MYTFYCKIIRVYRFPGGRSRLPRPLHRAAGVTKGRTIPKLLPAFRTKHIYLPSILFYGTLIHRPAVWAKELQERFL